MNEEDAACRVAWHRGRFSTPSIMGQRTLKAASTKLEIMIENDEYVDMHTSQDAHRSSGRSVAMRRPCIRSGMNTMKIINSRLLSCLAWIMESTTEEAATAGYPMINRDSRLSRRSRSSEVAASGVSGEIKGRMFFTSTNTARIHDMDG